MATKTFPKKSSMLTRIAFGSNGTLVEGSWRPNVARGSSLSVVRTKCERLNNENDGARLVGAEKQFSAATTSVRYPRRNYASMLEERRLV